MCATATHTHPALPQQGQLQRRARLAEQVKQTIVMAHENDPDLAPRQLPVLEDEIFGDHAAGADVSQ